MQKHKKLKARILSLAMSVIMVATTIPAPVFAAREGGTWPDADASGIIVSFDKLEDRFEPSTGEEASEHIYGLAVELDTPYEDLELPTELTAMVKRTTTTVSTPSDAEDTEDTVPDHQPASPSDAEEEVTEEIEDEDVPLALEPEDEETTVITVEQETISVTWNSDKEYVSDENGQFIYTAEISEDYILADGVELPQIYVLVGRQARSAGLAHDISTAPLTLTNSDGCSEGTPHVVSGTTKTNTITVTSDTHYVTLDGMSIDASTCAFDIQGTSTVNLTLAEGKTNTLKSGNQKACLAVPDGTTLSIGGTGSLTVTGKGRGAGIGGQEFGAGGTISITDGTVTANGGEYAAGIGGGSVGIGGEIIITGGMVTATGGMGGAGIGSGMNGASGPSGAGGTISITGGTVIATGGMLAAGIGGGTDRLPAEVSITGGTVTATGGQQGAGIGCGGPNSRDGNISITGGTVTATGTGGGEAVGSGSGGFTGTLTLTGMEAKYNVGGSAYTGATHVADNRIYQGTEGTTPATDVKIGEATSSPITVTINGTEYAGSTLQEAIGKLQGGAAAVTSLKITEGEVTEADWNYLKSLTALTTFEIDNAVTPVANIPNGTENTRIFPWNIETVTVPQAVTIGEHAFDYCSKLTSADFPLATSIGNKAFYYCGSLVSVSIPKATSIGDSAFYMCKKLTSISFPEATSVGETAFSNCAALTSVSFPKATSIVSFAFSECKTLASASFPEATSIGDNAFYNCFALTTATFPVATSIDFCAFDGCKALASASFPEVTSIGEAAFKGNGALTSASFPKVTSIGEGAFNNCTALATLKLGATPPTTVETDAFKNCPTTRALGYVAADGNDLTGTDLTSAQAAYKKVADADGKWHGWTIGAAAVAITVTINGTEYTGSSFQEIIGKLQGGAAAVTSLKITAGAVTEADWNDLKNLTAMTTFEIADDVAVTAVADIPAGTKTAPIFPPSIETATVPQKIIIGENAFRGCAALTTVSFPEATSIGMQAFGDCAALTTVSFSKATSIDNSTFYGCTALTSVSFPAVKSMSGGAFNGCTKLTSASFPAATSIDFNAFSGCTALATLKLSAIPPTVGEDAFKDCPATRALGYVDAEGKDLAGDALAAAITAYKAAADTDGKWYGWTIEAAVAITVTINGTEYEGSTLQEAIGKLQGGATAVTTLKITEGEVTEADWKYLKSLTAMTTFEIAGDLAVTAVANIPNGTSNAAIFPPSIETATVPQAITIGNNVFYGCNKLTSVSFPKATSIGMYAFFDCTALTSVSFPVATSIDSFAFQGCTALTSASFPAAKSIGIMAFYGCIALTSVSFPTAASIGTYAFQNCTALTTLELGATPPTTVGTGAFSGCPATRALGYVDADGNALTGTALTAAITAYKAAAGTDGKWYGWTIEEATLAHDISTGNLTLTDTSGVCITGCSESAPHVVTGTTTANKIEVTSGTHYVTLDGVSITTTSAGGPFAINAGTVNLTLKGTNILTAQKVSGGGAPAGLFVKTGTTLTIDGTGSLTATGYKDSDWEEYGAGIGGSSTMQEVGTITIQGGTVTAVGSYGIGPGIDMTGIGDAGALTISGENTVVTATGLLTTAAVASTSLTLTGMEAKYKVNGAYTGATNISDNKIYEGTDQTTKAKDVKIAKATTLPDYTGTQAAAPSSTPASKTDTQIVLAAVTVTGETIEYAKSTGTTAPTTDADWQTGTTFTGLTADTQYYFFARVKASATHKAGTASSGTAIKTDKTEAQKVAAAKALAEIALGNLTATNATTADDVLGAINTALAGTGVTAAWDASGAFDKTLATDSAAGSVTGTIKLTCGKASDTVSLNLPIARLGSDEEKAASAKTAAVAALSGYTATNATADSDIMALINKAITDAGITGVTATWKSGSGFDKTEATVSATGIVTGIITLTINSATADVTVNLTIAQLADKAALTTAITAANNAKAGISVNDNPASSVTKGTKFVTTAEMKALTDAIAAAEAVVNDTAGTAAQVSAAITAMNNAVTAFNAAIKTGTYTSSGGGGGSSSGQTIYTSVPPSYTGGTKIIGNVRVPDYTVEGTWKKSANGTWNFSGKDGKTYANSWAPVFNSYADVTKGQSAFDWFKFDASGNMITGWHTDTDGNTYYLNPNSDNTLGAMKTGWVLIDGKYYYFNEKPDGTRGKLFQNTRTPDGYFVDKNGVWDGKDK